MKKRLVGLIVHCLAFLRWLTAAPPGVSVDTPLYDIKLLYDSPFGEEDDDYFASRVELPRVHSLYDEQQQLQRFDMGLTIYNHSNSDLWTVYDNVAVSRIGGEVDSATRLLVNDLAINTGSNAAPSDKQHTTYSSIHKPTFSAKGCVTTFVLGNEPVVTTSQLNDKLYSARGDLLIIFGFAVELITSEFLSFLEQRNVIVGFLQKISPISRVLRTDLYARGIAMIDNLVLPDNLDVTQSSLMYYGFLMVFAPFANGTSRTSPGAFSEYVNIAELTLVTATKDMQKMCSNKLLGNPFVLSNDFWPSTIPTFPPGITKPSLAHVVSENGRGFDWLTFSDHFGTHVEMPYRLVAPRYSADDLPARYSLAPCVKVDARGLPASSSIPPTLFQEWERRFNRSIPEYSIVLVETGQGRFWAENPAKYSSGYLGLHWKTTTWLINERKILGVGIDGPSLDSYAETKKHTLRSQVILAQNDAIGLVNLASAPLRLFPERGGVCLYVFFRVEKGTGSPAAVFGLVESIVTSSGSSSKQFLWYRVLLLQNAIVCYLTSLLFYRTSFL